MVMIVKEVKLGYFRGTYFLQFDYDWWCFLQILDQETKATSRLTRIINWLNPIAKKLGF